MAPVRSLCLITIACLTFGDARRIARYEHEAVGLRVRRQNGVQSSSIQGLAVTTPASPLTTIYPSSGATPVLITEQSQLITSYIPLFTLCALSAIAPLPSTLTPTSVSTSPEDLGSCTVIYSTTHSIVCATTLSDLTTSYPVTNCVQDITFSTEYGYTLVTPSPTAGVSATASDNSPNVITPPPSIQTLTTYYIAPWQDLTSAGPPGDVDYKICTGSPNGTEHCVLEYYQWKTSLLTITSQVTTSINLTTVIPGPSQLIVETFVANVTGTATTLSMSTTMELETSTLSDTTHISTRPSSSAFSTATSTVHLQYASQSHSVRTTTIHTTITSTVGTSTITVTRPSSAAIVSSLSAPSIPTSVLASLIPSTIDVPIDSVSQSSLEGAVPSI